MRIANKSKTTAEELVSIIESVALELNKSPGDVTENDLKGVISSRQLRNHGGISLLKKVYFPETEKDLGSILKHKKQASYISKLETRVGQSELIKKEITDSINKLIQPIPKLKSSVKSKKNTGKREIVAMLNDTHYGLNVDAEEIDGLNAFSWTEACRRTAFFTNEVANYKLHARKETQKLHLILNGDLLAGLIHGLASKTLDLYIHQVNGALHILTNVITHLSNHFDEIEVHGIGGNHEELPHKREGGHRVTQEHYDNFINAVFYSLSVVFKNNKHISFNIPKTPYLFFNLPAGRAMVCHGHNMFSKALGNPGKSINVKLLTNEIREFNVGEQLKGREPVKLVLFGHTHSYAHFITNDGVEVYVAPSLSGLDAYAHQLNINTNFIGQVVFESTKEFILGDSRLIRLKQADSDSEMDKIIPVFKQELKFKKD